MLIRGIMSEKTINSRGDENILVTVETSKGKTYASAPSGKSRGKHEAKEFSSRGIDFSLSLIDLIGKKLVANKTTFKTFDDLKKVEELVRQYDKTEKWEVFGGNALFALEAAILKGMALEQDKELWEFLNPKATRVPFPIGNCIGGGAHSKKEEHPDIQEFLVLPKSRHFYDAYFVNLQVYKLAKQLVTEKDKTWDGELTDEKAICPNLSEEQIFNILKEIDNQIITKFNIELKLGVDIAASTLWKNGIYEYLNPKRRLTTKEQLDYIKDLIERHGLYYIEDPFHEDDFDSFAQLLKQTRNALIVGDDLTVTNPKRLKMAIEKKAVNAVIVKPNQTGSLITTKQFIDLAKEYRITPIISHRSGETADNTIADLAVAWGIPIIKTGILGKERIAKLHRLLKIERAIHSKKA